ncbi:hypothetical protein DFAR_630028 [Desulfarculales bacterium]
MVGKKLDILYTERTEECFHKGQRVARNRRVLEQSGFPHLDRAHAPLLPGARQVGSRKNHQLDTQDRRGHGQTGRGDHEPAGTSPTRLQGLPKPGHPSQKTW